MAEQIVPDETVTVGNAARFFGISVGTVFYSLRKGKLTAYTVPSQTHGTVTGVSLREAALIWGHRLRSPQKTKAR